MEAELPQARTEATRAALMAAAREALVDGGFEAATAREIARRADVNQALVFYHFGTVSDLLVAVLDEVSARRMASYRPLLEEARSLGDLFDAGGEVMASDLAGGDLAVLVALMTGARATPDLAAQVTNRLEPWRAFAREAVTKAARWLPLGRFMPVEEVADALLAGILGLELLAHTTDEDDVVRRVIDRAAGLGGLLAATAGIPDE